MPWIGGRRVVAVCVAALLAAGGTFAIMAVSSGAAKRPARSAAALPLRLGYVASVSASVQRPIGRRLVIRPHATYVVQRPALAKVLRTLVSRHAGTWHPRMTLVYRVKVSSVPRHGKGRTLVKLSRTLSGRALIATARRSLNTTKFHLGRFVLSPARTARIKRAVKRSGKLLLSSSANYRVRFTAHGRTVTLRGVPWSFSYVFHRNAPPAGGVKLRRLSVGLRRVIAVAQRLPLACEVRNELVRRLRITASLLLSGRRSDAAGVLKVWTARTGLMGGGVLSAQQQTVLRDRLRSILRRVGTGYPAKLGRGVRWPALPSCGRTARTAAVSDTTTENEFFKALILGMVSMIPEVGGMLSRMFGILWPSNNETQNLKALADQITQQTVRDQAKTFLGNVDCPECTPYPISASGLAGNVSDFIAKEHSVNATDGTVQNAFGTATAFFTNQRAVFNPLEGTANANYRWELLPLFVQYENLYLSLLAEGVRNGVQWGLPQSYVDETVPNDGSDSIEETLRKEISYANNYAYAVLRHRVRTDLGCKYPDSYAIPPDDTSCATDPGAVFAKTSADQRTFQLQVGDYQAMWKLYDPLAYPNGDPAFKLTRMIYSDRVGVPRNPFIVPGNVQYPLSSVQAWHKYVKNAWPPGSVDAVKADNSPLAGPVTGVGESPPGDKTWLVGPTSLGTSYHGEIIRAWADDTASNCDGCDPPFIDGIHVEFADGSTDQLGWDARYSGHFGYDNESLQTVRITGAWRPRPTLYPNSHYGDSLVFGFRFTDSFYSAGQVQSVGTAGKCLDLSSWAVGTQAVLNPCGATTSSLTQDWTYNGSTRQLSSSNGGPSTNRTNAGTVCLEARSAGTTAGTPVDIYDCSERPRSDVPTLYTALQPTTAQQWIVSSDGTITNVASKLCLDSADPAMLTLNVCNGSSTQRWGTRWTTRLLGTVRVPDTQACLGAAGTRESALQDVQVQSCDGSWNQSWYYGTVDNSTEHAPDLVYHALSVYGGAKCLVNPANLNSVLPVPANIQTCDGTDRQKWTLTADSQTICSVLKGTLATDPPITITWCIRGNNGQTDPGTAIYVWPVGPTEQPPLGTQWVWPTE